MRIIICVLQQRIGDRGKEVDTTGRNHHPWLSSHFCSSSSRLASVRGGIWRLTTHSVYLEPQPRKASGINLHRGQKGGNVASLKMDLHFLNHSWTTNSQGTDFLPLLFVVPSCSISRLLFHFEMGFTKLPRVTPSASQVAAIYWKPVPTNTALLSVF